MGDEFKQAGNQALSMGSKEQQEFLAETRIGIMSMGRKELGPLSMPVCYGYEPGGEVRTVIDGGSFKAKLVERTGRFTLCVQDDVPPYRFVTVEGPATLEPADSEEDLGPIIRRYLGTPRGNKYVELSREASLSAGHSALVVARMRPEHWWSWDLHRDSGWDQIMAQPPA